MKVKTYQSKSLQEALDNIKRDLGAEALILSTRAIPRTRALGFLSREKWEITAAVNDSMPVRTATPEPPALSAAETIMQRRQGAVETSGARISGRPGLALAPALAVAPAPAPVAERTPIALPRPDRRIDELLEEMDELKRSVRIIGKAMPSKSQEAGGSLYGELVSQGIDTDMADRLVSTASRGNPSPSEIRDRVLKLLADMIVIDPPAELVAKSRIVSVFVGPTGVGKTTTIAKIAGHASARLKKKVALISTDFLRVGGQELLSRFGGLLGVPTYVCSDITALKKLIDSLDDRDLILIDTPGASPADMTRLSKLEAVLQEAGARVNLVMSATTRSEDVTRIIKRFQPFAPKRVTFTKVDETDFKSAFVGDLLRNELAISYITNGQRVPEDLMMPGAMDLARYVLPTEPGNVQ
jgi:flagellar biosynthesis protein FlhF